MLKHTNNFSQIAILMFLVIIEIMGVGLVTPLLPALFVEPSSPIIAPTAPITLRNFYFGVALGIWPAGMFFGIPLLGELSDKIGRKKIFITCLVATAISYVFSALAILVHSIWLFFLSRLFAGFFAGSYEIAQAATADLSTPETKARNLGWIILALNIGFIAGPAVTTVVALVTSYAMLNLILPFVIAALLALINALIIGMFFQETYRPQNKPTLQVRKLFAAFIFIFVDRRVRFLGLIFFFLVVSWIGFFSGIPLLLSEHYHQGVKTVALFFISIGVGAILCILLLQTKIFKRFALKSVAIITFSLSAMILILLVLQSSLFITWILVTVFAFVEVMGYTCFISLVSNAVSSDEQGKTMGGLAAVSSVAFCLTSLITGIVASINIFLPLLIAAFCYLISVSALWKK